MEKILIIPSKGLGDLMIMLNLANICRSNFEVHVCHDLLEKISNFFPHLKIHSRQELFEKIKLYDFKKCILVFETGEFFINAYENLKLHFSNNFYVLNPVVTAKKDYVFSDHFFFNPDISFVENLNVFAKDSLKISSSEKTTGLICDVKKEKDLIVIHPSASKPSKSWGSDKFKKLEAKLKKQGFRVIYATLPFEKSYIENGLYSNLATLEELVHVLLKASLLIGNDSGVSHLASACNTPSVIISRNARIQKFWGPDFEGKAHPLFPPRFLPNLKGLRIRDKHWRHFVFMFQVLKKVKAILNLNAN
jgi:hypothetical protein